MATSFSYTNRIVNFHYLYQKIITGELYNKINVRRIGVWCLHHDSRRKGVLKKEIGHNRPRMEQRRNYCIINSIGDQLPDDLLELKALLKVCPANSEGGIHRNLWEKFKHIDEKRWEVLYKDIIKPKHIAGLWEAAEERYKDREGARESCLEADVLSCDKAFSPQYWNGKFCKGYPLWPIVNFQMAFFRDDEGNLYGGLIPGECYFRICSGVHVTDGCLLAENFRQSIRDTGKFSAKSTINKVYPSDFRIALRTDVKYDFAFAIGDGKLPLCNVPKNFLNHAKLYRWLLHLQVFNSLLRLLVFNSQVYIRAVGPNVLVGKVWKASEQRGDLVLVKAKPQ